MLSYVHLEPPVIRNVAGGHRLSGVGKGIMIVDVEDQLGIKHPVQLPVTIVPGLGHLFSGGTEPGHIKQPESTSLGDEPEKTQVHRSSHRSASRTDQTRNNHRASLQQQQPAQRHVLQEDRQRISRKRSNMSHHHGDTRRIFHTTPENSRSITEKLLDSTVQQERTTSTT